MSQSGFSILARSLAARHCVTPLGAQIVDDHSVLFAIYSLRPVTFCVEGVRRTPITKFLYLIVVRYSAPVMFLDQLTALAGFTERVLWEVRQQVLSRVSLPPETGFPVLGHVQGSLPILASARFLRLWTIRGIPTRL